MQSAFSYLIPPFVILRVLDLHMRHLLIILAYPLRGIKRFLSCPRRRIRSDSGFASVRLAAMALSGSSRLWFCPAPGSSSVPLLAMAPSCSWLWLSCSRLKLRPAPGYGPVLLLAMAPPAQAVENAPLFFFQKTVDFAGGILYNGKAFEQMRGEVA